MVLIPNDIGIRMRLQNDAQLLTPVTPVAEIAVDLPELLPGQLFSARIKEVLPQGSYKALVGGKEITLALPDAAKPGDTLELVVVDRSAKAIVAALATKTALGTAQGQSPTAYPFTRLSSAAQLIGSLLPNEGESAPAAALNAGQPILSGPPRSAAQLAEALQQAVKSSGVFYEAHQAQWVTGRFPLAELLNEPQAQRSDFNRLVGALLTAEKNAPNALSTLSTLVDPITDGDSAPTISAQAAAASQLEDSAKSALVGRRSDGLPTPDLPAGKAGESSAPSSSTSAIRGTAESLAPAASAAAAPQRMPEEIRPIVQQQLDALATDRLVWHGEAWPQQTLEWQIERDAHQGGADDDGPRWNTRLALTTPRLGEVDARLQLTQDGVRIVLHAKDTETAERLRAALPVLRESLDAAGVPLRGFAVRDVTSAEPLGDAATDSAEAPDAAPPASDSRPEDA
jgi:flagellar hook-length control protein FliK